MVNCPSCMPPPPLGSQSNELKQHLPDACGGCTACLSAPAAPLCCTTWGTAPARPSYTATVSQHESKGSIGWGTGRSAYGARGEGRRVGGQVRGAKRCARLYRYVDRPRHMNSRVSLHNECFKHHLWAVPGRGGKADSVRAHWGHLEATASCSQLK